MTGEQINLAEFFAQSAEAATTPPAEKQRPVYDLFIALLANFLVACSYALGGWFVIWLLGWPG